MKQGQKPNALAKKAAFRVEQFARERPRTYPEDSTPAEKRIRNQFLGDPRAAFLDSFAKPNQKIAQAMRLAEKTRDETRHGKARAASVFGILEEARKARQPK